MRASSRRVAAVMLLATTSASQPSAPALVQSPYAHQPSGSSLSVLICPIGASKIVQPLQSVQAVRGWRDTELALRRRLNSLQRLHVAHPGRPTRLAGPGRQQPACSTRGRWSSTSMLAERPRAALAVASRSGGPPLVDRPAPSTATPRTSRASASSSTRTRRSRSPASSATTSRTSWRWSAMGRR